MDDFKKTIADAVGTAAKSSNKFLKSAKLSLSVSNEEMNLKQLYEEIGRKVREVYLFGGSLGAVFDAKNAEVAEQEAKISRLKEEQTRLKGTKNCAACGTSNPSESGFCKKCGARFGEEAAGFTPARQIIDTRGVDMPESPASVVPPVKEAAGPRCPGCGAQNDAGEKFCLSCGRML